MKKTIKYISIFLLLGLTFTLSDCKKDKFLNINTNPNYPATVGVNLVLPTTEANIGYMVGNQLAIYGGLWAQYWTQDPTYGSQYGNYDSYVNTPGDNDNLWQALYTTATNLNFIINNYDTAQKNYAAIAYFMKAYDFQLITDAWGNVPVSQALQGPKGITSPKYDPQQVVYDSLVVWVKAGLNLIDNNYTSPAEDLIYPNQPMSQWQKFANTLLLKIYLRESAVNASVSQQGIQALGTGPFLAVPTSPGGDDATLHYIAATFQQFPLYATGLFLEVRNITGSATAVNYLQNLNDPRLADFYSLAANGNYGGEPQGAWRNLIGATDAGFSPPNTTEIISPTASTRLMTASESFFLQAEAVSRGYMAGSASSLYTQGITASFQSWPNAAATGNVSAYMAQDSVAWNNASGQQAIKLIQTQKWISMCGNQNFEAWTEWRRTAYPDIFTPSLSSLISPGQWPLRLVYPSAEINENLNYPGSVAIYVPVWWGLNI
jgi:hypothetical protein